MTDSTILVVSFNGDKFRAGMPAFMDRLEEVRRIAGRSWDFILLQEGVDADDESRSLAEDAVGALNDRAKEFGRREELYAAHWDKLTTSNPDAFQDPVVIYNAARLHLHDADRDAYVIPIAQPKRYTLLGRIFAIELSHLPLWKRLMTKERPKKRTVCGVSLTLGAGKPFDVMSMHLEAFGGNPFRRRQFLGALNGRAARGGSARRIVCGDLNVSAPWYLPSARSQRKELALFLTEVDLKDPGREQTHYYTRMSNGFIRLLGRLRILPSSKFDVIAASMPILQHGTVEAVVDGEHISDHDVLWAVVDVDSSADVG